MSEQVEANGNSDFTSIPQSEIRPIVPTHYQDSLLLNHHADYLAKEQPNAVWAEIPRFGNSYAGGFREVTYSHLANAIDGAANFLVEKFGWGSNDFPTVAYFGPWDIRTVVFVLGAAKAKYQICFPAPAHTFESLSRLFQNVGGYLIVTADPNHSLVRRYSEVWPTKIVNIPRVTDLLDVKHNSVPYNKIYMDAHDEPLVVLHTSGSVTDTKPHYWNHAWVAAFVDGINLPAPQGFSNLSTMLQGKRVLNMMPHHHADNLFHTLITSLTCGFTLVFPTHTSEPSLPCLVDILIHTSVDVAILPNHLIESLAVDENSSALRRLTEKVATTFYTGGPVSLLAAEKLTRATNFHTIYGTTEAGIFPSLYPVVEAGPSTEKAEAGATEMGDASTTIGTRSDLLRPHPLSGSKMHPIGDGTFQPLLVHDLSDDEKVQPLFRMFPNTAEYAVRDLWKPHGTRATITTGAEGDQKAAGEAPAATQDEAVGVEAWEYVSLSDSIMDLPNSGGEGGGKLNTLDFEKKVCKHPDVAAALLLGKGSCSSEDGERVMAKAVAPILLIELVWPPPTPTSTPQGQPQQHLTLEDPYAGSKPSNVAAALALEQLAADATKRHLWRTQPGAKLELVWPAIAAANRLVPEPARIGKAQVLFAEQDRPLYRGFKGVVRRERALWDYREEIALLEEKLRGYKALLEGSAGAGGQ